MAASNYASATVVGGEKMLLLLRRRRLPLAKLTNLASATSITRLKPVARSKPSTSPSASSTRSIAEDHEGSRHKTPPLRDQFLSSRASFADLTAQHSGCSSTHCDGDVVFHELFVTKRQCVDMVKLTSTSKMFGSISIDSCWKQATSLRSVTLSSI